MERRGFGVESNISWAFGGAFNVGFKVDLVFGVDYVS